MHVCRRKEAKRRRNCGDYKPTKADITQYTFAAVNVKNVSYAQPRGEVRKLLMIAPLNELAFQKTDSKGQMLK